MVGITWRLLANRPTKYVWRATKPPWLCCNCETSRGPRKKCDRPVVGERSMCSKRAFPNGCAGFVNILLREEGGSRLAPGLERTMARTDAEAYRCATQCALQLFAWDNGREGKQSENIVMLSIRKTTCLSVSKLLEVVQEGAFLSCSACLPKQVTRQKHFLNSLLFQSKQNSTLKASSFNITSGVDHFCSAPMHAGLRPK